MASELRTNEQLPPQEEMEQENENDEKNGRKRKRKEANQEAASQKKTKRGRSLLILEDCTIESSDEVYPHRHSILKNFMIPNATKDELNLMQAIATLDSLLLDVPELGIKAPLECVMHWLQNRDADFIEFRISYAQLHNAMEQLKALETQGRLRRLLDRQFFAFSRGNVFLDVDVVIINTFVKEK